MSFQTKENSLTSGEPYELHKFWIGEETISVAESNQVIRFVDPDAPGPIHDGLSWDTAYLSLYDWNTAEATDLVSDGKYHTVYCRSSNGTPDTGGTSRVIITGWTTDATHYIEIAGADFPSDGIWDDTAYRVYISSTCIEICEDFVYLINLQLHCWEVSDDFLRGVMVELVSSSAIINIDSCIIRCTGLSASNTNVGIYNISPGTVNVYNCLVYDWTPYRSPAIGGSYGIRQISTGTTNVYNCTVYNCSNVGIQRTQGTMTAKNCIVGECGNDFDGTITISNCCSDDGDGTNPQTPSGGDWDNEFVDKDNRNFKLLPGGNCVGNGLYDPSNGLYSDDIGGNPRLGSWDIGSSEYIPYEVQELPIYWLYADAPTDIVYNGQTYTKCWCPGGKIEAGTNVVKSRTTVRFDWKNPFCWQYTTAIPSSTIHYKRYKGHGSDVQLTFVGDVLCVEFKQVSRQGERYAEVTIEPPRAQLGYMGLVSRYSRQCTVELYSTQCGVNSALYGVSGTLDSYSGNVLTSTTFGTQADGYWSGGYILINGMYACIVDHSGNDITILPYLYDISASDGFTIYPGCDHLSTTCDTKFSNLANYKGQPNIPIQNIFDAEAMFE